MSLLNIGIPGAKNVTVRSVFIHGLTIEMMGMMTPRLAVRIMLTKVMISVNIMVTRAVQ